MAHLYIIVDLPMKHGDFPVRYVSLPEDYLNHHKSPTKTPMKSHERIHCGIVFKGIYKGLNTSYLNGAIYIYMLRDQPP